MQKNDFVAIADAKLLLHTPDDQTPRVNHPSGSVSLSLPENCMHKKQVEQVQL